MNDDDRRGTLTRIAQLEEEACSYELSRFSLDDAWLLGSWIRNTAAQRGAAIVIEIRRGEQLAFAAALPGTTADHVAWASRKAATVRRFAVPSRLVGCRLQVKGQDLRHYGLEPAHYATLGGCCPIVVEGSGPVGTVAVSGLPEDDDHALVVEALRWLREYHWKSAAL